jgi:DNA helicase IV
MTTSSSASSSTSAASAIISRDKEQSSITAMTMKSTRQLFKETSVHPSIRRYIEMIGVGIPSKRKRSASARKRLWDDLEEGRRSSGNRAMSATQPPSPFASGSEGGQHRVVVIGSVATIHDTLPTNQDRIPEVVSTTKGSVFVYCLFAS